MHPREHIDPVKLYLVFGEHANERKRRKTQRTVNEVKPWIWNILVYVKTDHRMTFLEHTLEFSN